MFEQAHRLSQQLRDAEMMASTIRSVVRSICFRKDGIELRINPHAMICWKVIMMMLDDVRIGGRPEHHRDDCPQKRQRSSAAKRDTHSERRAQLPRQRIGDEPTDMAERKLGSKQGGPIRRA